MIGRRTTSEKMTKRCIRMARKRKQQGKQLHGERWQRRRTTTVRKTTKDRQKKEEDGIKEDNK